MRTESDLRIICECELAKFDSLNIERFPITDWKLRKTSAWYGQCTKQHKSTGTSCYIEISREYFLNASDYQVRNTIMHEICHTAVGAKHHDAFWQTVAAKCNNAFGYSIQRVGGGVEEGTSKYTLEREPYRYEVVCDCGHFWKYRRNCWTIECASTGNSTCPYCGGHHFTIKDLTATVKPTPAPTQVTAPSEQPTRRNRRQFWTLSDGFHGNIDELADHLDWHDKRGYYADGLFEWLKGRAALAPQVEAKFPGLTYIRVK